MKNLLTLIFMSVCINTGMITAQETNNTFMYKIGNSEVYLLSEGQQTGNTGILIGANQKMLQNTVPNGNFPNATNAFLVRSSGKNILIDAGYGRNLFTNLKSAGLDANQIDIVLITHMHGDHIGGLLTDGKPSFPNAAFYLSQKEYDYWMSNDEMIKLAENRRGSFQSARRVIAAYKNNLHLFQPDTIDADAHMMLPDIQGITAYGHTPGHTCFMIGSGKQKLLIWGDLTHAMAIQMKYPQVAVTYDVNPEQAIIYRKAILEYVAKNNIPIAGMHIAFPGIGNVETAEEGYVFTPIN